MTLETFYLRFCYTTLIIHGLCRGVISLELGLTFLEEPQDVLVKKGSSFLWNCSAKVTSPSDKENVTITWRKDGTNIQEKRRSVLRNGALFFKRIVHRKDRGQSDEGDYECLVHNSQGVLVSRRARLHVADLSKTLNESQEVSVVEGEVVRLQCPINAQPSATYTWEQDKNSLPQNNRFTVFPSGDLEIRQIAIADSSRYRCVAAVGGDSRASVNIKITVQPASPGTVVEVRGLSAVEQFVTEPLGGTVYMECAATGLPIPTLSWTYKTGDGDTMPLAVADIHSTRVGQGSLKLTNVNRTNSGIFTCYTTTTNEVVSTVYLTVVERPYFTQKGRPVSIREMVHGEARFTCSFGGSPQPQVTWMKNSKPISNDPGQRIQIRGQRLTISKLHASDSGYYQCRGENAGGTEQGSARLYVLPSQNAPDSPTNLRVVDLQSSSVTVAWDPPATKNGRKVLAFSVNYFPVGEEGVQSVTEKPEVTLQPLKPFTNYSLCVIAYNNETGSRESPTITFTTREDVPIAMPEVRVRALGATSLQVDWEPLSVQEARGIVTMYQVIFHKSDTNRLNYEVVEGQTTTLIISDLEAGTVYDVTVRASTNAGWSMLYERDWPWASNSTTAMDKLTLTPLDNCTMRLSWLPTSSESDVVYTVRYKIAGEGTISNSSYTYVQSKSNVMTLENLRPSTLYQFSIQSSIDTEFSSVQEARTLSHVPSAPVDVTVMAIDVDTVEVSWRPPLKYNQNLQSYVILYTTQDNIPDSQWNKKTENGTVQRSYISELESGMLYMFKVYAVNAGGHGPPSATITTHMPSTGVSSSMQQVGIIIGVMVIACILLSTIIILCRRRCYSPNKPSGLMQNGTGNGHVVTGEGRLPSSSYRSRVASVEMDSMAPMSTSNSPHTSLQVDAKGDSKLSNGVHTNGHQLIFPPNEPLLWVASQHKDKPELPIWRTIRDEEEARVGKEEEEEEGGGSLSASLEGIDHQHVHHGDRHTAEREPMLKHKTDVSSSSGRDCRPLEGTPCHTGSFNTRGPSSNPHTHLLQASESSY